MPPNSPSNLTAAANSGTQIQLTWRDNSATETGFQVQRSTDGVTFTHSPPWAPDEDQYTDSTVRTGRSYYYRVPASNGAGNSGFSNVASARTGRVPALRRRPPT